VGGLQNAPTARRRLPGHRRADGGPGVLTVADKRVVPLRASSAVAKTPAAGPQKTLRSRGKPDTPG